MNQPYNIENKGSTSSPSNSPTRTSIHFDPTTLHLRDETASIDDGSQLSTPRMQATEEDPYESVPDVLDSTSVKSDGDLDSDDEEEDDDMFDPEGLPMPRLSSSTIPVAMEVVRPSNTGRYTSEDPLFQGVCLYHYVSSSTREEPAEKKTEATTQSRTPPQRQTHQLTRSWFFPAMFQHLLDMRQQRVVE